MNEDEARGNEEASIEDVAVSESKSESHLITVSLKAHHDLEAQVNSYAKKTGLKKAEIVRRALIRYLADPNVQEQARLAENQETQQGA